MADTGTPCQLAIADQPSTQWCFTVYDTRGMRIRSSSDSSSGCATRPSTRRRQAAGSPSIGMVREMKYLGSAALRSLAGYVRASRVGEYRSFSPTQSFTRLMLHMPGRTRVPPSHPHAASNAAAPLPRPNVTNERLSMPWGLASWRLGVCLSVMAREPPPVRSSEHGAQRGGIHGEHENHVHDRERDEDPHNPEVPIARRLKSAEQRRQPGQLRRLVNREAGEHRERAQPDHTRVRELLERVVFALRRMFPTEMEVVLRHLDRAPNVPRPEQQGAPLATPHQVSEIQETEGDERPRQREVPVERAREPAAEPAPVRELGAVEWAHEVRPPAVSEPGVSFVDLETARDHAGEYDHGRPMGEADDPVVAAHGRSGGGSHSAQGNLGTSPVRRHPPRFPGRPDRP